MKFIIRTIALLCIAYSANIFANDSGWLEQKEGQTNEQGFTVKAIKSGEQGIKLITIAVPKEKLNSRKSDIEEVVVIGQRTEKRESLLRNVSYEWVDDFENGDYGLIIKLQEDSKMPLRLRFSVDESTVSP